ncbi:hypothetical protein [Pannonibacter carbonis]|uniref:hypothetical protein n=1 Tax=Pannonibacter carbonis TaxID=2067569 RepID=UPI000D0E46E1|nr:hypothetical protein [Pannonibacter carbonis]
MMILNSLKTAMSFAGGGMTRATGTGTGNSGGLSGAGGKSQGPLPGLTLSDELVEDIKKSVETSQSLQRSMESARDGARGEKVARLKEKIEQLKERIRFASPQQAKALMKELKQLAKEFKGAAKELGSEAQSLASPAAAAAGSGLIQPDGGAATAEMLAGAAPVNQTDPARQPDPTKTADADDPEGADAADPQADRQQDLRKAVLSYVSEQMREEIMVAGGRAEAMKLERDEFEKIGKEIKYLAGQIELLHKLGKGDRDDKIRRDRKGVLDALEDGIDRLNDPKVIRAIDGAIAARSALGTQPDAPSEPVTADVSPQLGSLAYSLQTSASLTVPASGRVA